MVRKAALMLAFMASAAHSQDARPSFQGVSLGMSRAEIDYSLSKEGRTPVLCSDDPKSNVAMKPSPEESAIGVVYCQFSRDSSAVQLSDSIRVSAFIMLYEGKVILIGVFGQSVNRQAIEGALTAKLGKPSSSETRELQNGFGVKFPQDVVSWETGTDSVDLKSPYLRRGDLNISYSDKAAVKRMNDAKTAEAGKLLKM